jgi:hypothetical protein
MICRHCHQANVNRPRGLYWSCFYKPGVRELYPSTSMYARRGIGNGYRRPRLPDRPTTAPPLSEEKILVMSERAGRGESLFHPQDLA